MGACRTTASGEWIGYTEYRTDLPGGRHANVATMRACLVRANGTGRAVLAEGLIGDGDTWTQFAGWSPDGRFAAIGCGWESPENAAWEEAHREFRMTEGWRCDMHLLELATGRLTSPTAVERVSDYNAGLFFWPGDASRLGFTALIDGVSHPFVMDIDGRNKRDLSQTANGFAYGYSASPDGGRVAYHEDYQVYIARADGSSKTHVATGNPFNFGPVWSPDGQWILFVSGQHYDCHPWIVRPDGTEPRKIADRNGYRGVVEFLDVYDFHGGSSDTPIWFPDGRSICFAAAIDDRVELFRATCDGEVRRLTHCDRGAANYHPRFSPDGRSLVFGSTRSGLRQLHVLCIETGRTDVITNVQAGWGAMWAHWQPA
ncbi:MAG: hypothetical protein GXY33_22390 [Phycisphaerae bacterium]|nr:hypothetical protein [Phycisphaerae bacterium]